MTRFRRPAVMTAAAAIVVTAGSGTAFAYWSSTGTGTGTASTGTMTIQTKVLTAGDATASHTLIPGGTADAVVKVTNPNSFPVTLLTVTGNGSASASNGCAPTGVSFNTRSGLATSIPAGTTSIVDLPGAVTMTTSSVSACQGAKFTIPVTVTVQK